MSYPVRVSKPVGQKIASIYRDRISQLYSSGQYANNNLLAMIKEDVAAGHPHVKLSTWSAPGQDRPSFQHASQQEFLPTEVGKLFGPAWSTHWFKVFLTIPRHLLGAEHLELHWDCGGEAMVWNSAGEPLQGLSGKGERIEWIIPNSFRDGQEHCIFIEVACNGMFGNAPGDDLIQPPDPNKSYQLKEAALVAINNDARQLWIDTWVIGDAAREFPTDSWQQHQALTVANEILNTFELGNKASVVKCRKIAQKFVGQNVDSDAVYQTDTAPLVYGIGHCHIDSCWLWPWAETRRKVARSWSNQCDLMDRYPELRFACSQAQQYKWLMEDYPFVFERVKNKVKSGQFHPIGGSWVEHDTNMPSGESLVRQFLYGQRFFEHNFGKRCTTFWLPDTFGYSAQLPQLCRQAGMTRFMTQKLSWNNINTFPHTTFNWVGLDNSQVLCHMPPSETYTAEANFGDVMRSVSQHKSMDQDARSLLVFGKGDGGGGPTWQHLEKLRRCCGISNNVGLLPSLHLGKSVDEFFDDITPGASQLSTWYGELYFELHRGTYTTQANNKKYNRAAEFMLRDIELLASIASLDFSGYKYPIAEIQSMWEGVLLCQFHDCLPGSSIEMCYDDSDKVYEFVFRTGQKILGDIFSQLCLVAGGSDVGSQSVALNTCPWPRTEVVDVSAKHAGIASGDGLLIPVQQFEPSQHNCVTVEQIDDGTFVLQNSQLTATITNGSITSLVDRLAEREIIPDGCRANQFVLFDDKPLYWQAWDVEVYHLETRKELKAECSTIHQRDPHRVSVVTKYQIGTSSFIKSTLSLSSALPGETSYLECVCEVEWHETMKFLKVEFPVDILSAEASYETQFGVVKRPTHYNTSWDMARFEVCCHKFADISENGYGVSILNDSKYGFATTGNIMRLSLLRSPKAPDAHADMGNHTIRWAILPHKGSLSSTTVRAAYNFNNPLKLMSASSGEASIDLLERYQSRGVILTGDSSLVLDTVKRAESDFDAAANSGSQCRRIIIRIYDSLGGHAKGIVHVKWHLTKVVTANLLEDEGEEVAVRQGKFEVQLQPFEVATFCLFVA